MFAFEIEDWGWSSGQRNTSNLLQHVVVAFFGNADEKVMWNFKTGTGEEDHKLGVHVLHTFPPVLDGSKKDGGWTMSGCVSADFCVKNEIGEKINSCQKSFLLMRYVIRVGNMHFQLCKCVYELTCCNFAGGW